MLNHQVLKAPEAKTLAKTVIFYQIYEVRAICAAAPRRIEAIVQKDGGYIKYFLFLLVRDRWNEMRLIISDEIRAAIYILV